jgi:hypothetical protein
MGFFVFQRLAEKEGGIMATVKQIQYRLGQKKKKLAKLNKEVTKAGGNVKKLEAELKKAKGARKKKKATQKKGMKKREVVSFFSPVSFSKTGGRLVVKKKVAKMKKAKK